MPNFDFIIVGLGNPGKEYDNSRHNTGFMAIDFIADKLGVQIKNNKFKSLTCDAVIENHKVLLLKPQTYMNLSGQAVSNAMSYYKFSPDRVILLFDDISLPVGRIRIRKSGSHGGQNGVKNIINLCGTNLFPRIRIGIDNKPNSFWDLADWVLSKFNKNDIEILNKCFDDVFEAIKLIINNNIDIAMNKYN